MVNATQIARWAGTTPAQADLPRLIRRLIHGAVTTTELAMPAGDSVTLPGFDGELYSEHGNAWVPAGHSCWELSCRTDIVAKANEDYTKRSVEGGDQERELADYFRNQAVALEATHPHLGATLHELAKSYDRHGVFEDLDAQLRIEGR